MLLLSACTGGSAPLFGPPIPQAAPQPSVGGSRLGGVARPAAPDAAPVITAAELSAKTAARIQAVLGPAEFIRSEGDNAVWQYRAGDCVVDLFFAGRGQDARVAHMASRGGADVDACLRAVTSL
jgi:hypothetical protein